MDTGHLLLDGQSPSDFFRARQDRIKEIHLHDLDRKQAAADGRLIDHRRLREDEPWLPELLSLLKGFEGIVNLEVFSWEEAEAGIEVLRKFQIIG
jgi:sugar phosphate isomerase/epimerase